MNSRKFLGEPLIYLVDVRVLLFNFNTASLGGAPFKQDYTRVFRDYNHAISYAGALAKSSENKDGAAAIVYGAIDFRADKYFAPEFNPHNPSWNYALKPQDYAIIYAQPVRADDRDCEALLTPRVEYVPQPIFPAPRNKEELVRNLELYLLYRTGGERGHIPHLQRFIFFNGFDKSIKESAARALLAKLADIVCADLSKEQLAALNNGLLKTAVQGYEAIISKHSYVLR